MVQWNQYNKLGFNSSVANFLERTLMERKCSSVGLPNKATLQSNGQTNQLFTLHVKKWGGSPKEKNLNMPSYLKKGLGMGARQDLVQTFCVPFMLLPIYSSAQHTPLQTQLASHSSAPYLSSLINHLRRGLNLEYRGCIYCVHGVNFTILDSQYPR